MENVKIQVRRANRVLHVTENELDKYLAKGYEIMEDSQPKQVVSQPVEEKKVVATPKEVVKPVIQEPKQEVKKRPGKRKSTK